MKRVMALLLLATASAASAQTASEHLAPPADATMALGYAAAAQGQTIHEYVPLGETVEKWTRMVTVQSFPAPPGLTPEAFIARWGAMMGQGCPGADIGTPTPVTLSDRSGTELRIVCPRNPQTGKPETVVGRVITAEAGLLMVQAATRRHFTADDARWAESVLAGTKLCPAASTDARCVATARTDVGAPL